MKKKMRNGISVLLAAVFVISGALVIQHLYDYQVADKTYDAAQELAVSSEPEPSPEVMPELVPAEEPELLEEPVPMVPEPVEETIQEILEENAQFLLELDLNALRQTNDRVLGWIYIPDSPVDYPLLQVQDNNEYLRKAWDGTPNQAGCIFLECRNSTDFGDFNTLIYGHYMRNGKMFGSLRHYQEQEYRDTHPYIYIATDQGVRRYEVFAAYEAGVVSDTYRLVFEDDARKQSVLDCYLGSSVLESGIVPTVEDHILTLSTCTGTGTYDTRWVVQAVLTGEFSK